MLAESNVQSVSGPADFVFSGENLFDLFWGELVAIDVLDIVIVPVEARDDHSSIVALCIYNTVL